MLHVDPVIGGEAEDCSGISIQAPNLPGQPRGKIYRVTK